MMGPVAPMHVLEVRRIPIKDGEHLARLRIFELSLQESD
jgi:hypothetical protein